MTLSGGDVVRLSEMLAYQEGSVVSRQLVKNASGGVTLFAFAKGEGLSEHTTPHDALVVVLDGRAEITVMGATHAVAAGQAVFMPGGKPHAVAAPEPFTMLLVMLKNA
ncbi:MAG: cupin domain-containing protein [Gemmatimonadetes bacterium]|nr:cupin domain-containing protein [Gemmatimonadota bacterium]